MRTAHLKTKPSRRATSNRISRNVALRPVSLEDSPPLYPPRSQGLRGGRLGEGPGASGTRWGACQGRGARGVGHSVLLSAAEHTTPHPLPTSALALPCGAAPGARGVGQGPGRGLRRHPSDQDALWPRARELQVVGLLAELRPLDVSPICVGGAPKCHTHFSTNHTPN